MSDTLPQNIDAVATNTVGHGLDFPPLFPRSNPDTQEPVQPPAEAAAELARLKLWAATCAPEGLAAVADLVERDCETIGWGAFEVLRNREGAVAGISHIPGWQLRLGRLSPPLRVEQAGRDPSTGDLFSVPRIMRFRLYAQVVQDGTVRWFKEFGDPRRVNYLTGQTREGTAEAWKNAEGASLEATELVYQRIYCAYSPYGVPRWVGASASVRAGRSAAELVVRWFSDAPIGAKGIAVAGGTFAGNPLKRIMGKIDREGRGEQAAWALYGIEASLTPGDAGSDTTSTAAARIAVFDLGAPPPAELYSGEGSLIVSAGKRVEAAFRLPSVYMGRAADYSRAAADTARAVGEEQVIAPIRERRWHGWLNGVLLPSLGIRWWGLKFKPSITGDDVEAATPVADLAAQGAATPNQLQELAAKLMKIEPHRIHEPWADRPMPLVLAMIAAGRDPNGPLDAVDPTVGGAPVDGGQPTAAGALPAGAADVAATAYNGAQTTGMLEILKAVAEGWLPKPAAVHSLVVAFRMDTATAEAMVAPIVEGSAKPEPSPGFGAPPSTGAGGKGRPSPNRTMAAKALEGLATVNALYAAMGELEEQAAAGFDAGSIPIDRT